MNNVIKNYFAPLTVAGLMITTNASCRPYENVTNIFERSPLLEHFERNDKIEHEENNKGIDGRVETIQSQYRLSKRELKKAPSPDVVIAGEKQTAGIVVDVNNNKLYRYNEKGNVTDGCIVTTGAIDKNGKSKTPASIRVVDHMETYPYRSAVNTKRKRNPKAYGPNILYLTIVDPNTGNNLGSDGVFLHGNNNESQLGQHASHGCIRLPNEIIEQFAKEIKKGTLIKVINE